MRRGVLLSTITGSLVAITPMLPQLQYQHTKLHENRSGTVNMARKDVARPHVFNRNPLMVPSRVNDNYCVQSVAGLKNFVYVSGKTESLIAMMRKMMKIHTNSVTEQKYTNSKIISVQRQIVPMVHF